MLYALVDGELVTATPGNRGTCRSCGHEMIAKCGDIVTWHWAHAPDSDCVWSTAEETEYHLWWKSLVQPDYVEQTYIDDAGRRYRADIVGVGGIVEVQRSSISVADITRREDYYIYDQGLNLHWVVYCADARKGGRISLHPGGHFLKEHKRRFGDNNKLYDVIQWSHAKKTLAEVWGSHLWLDYGENDLLFEVCEMEKGLSECYGFLRSRWGFIKQIIGMDRLSRKGLRLLRNQGRALDHIRTLRSSATKWLYKKAALNVWQELHRNDGILFSEVCEIYRSYGLKDPDPKWAEEYYNAVHVDLNGETIVRRVIFDGKAQKTTNSVREGRTAYVT